MTIDAEFNGAPSIYLRSRAAAVALLMGGVALFGAGCAAPVGAGDDEEAVQDTTTSFEEFKAGVYQEPETGIYIVNGDTPIETEAGLAEFYERYIQDGAQIINRVGGVDDRWTNAQKLNITYCVSTAFGANHAAVVQAMQTAATDWHLAASVKFVYLSGQDATCDASNPNVIFDVNPVSGQPYLARSFFPSYARASRNVLIDSSSFGPIGPWTLAGILRHELGHTLGFRHEHTRPEAGVCFEDLNWRPLTVYDSSSVMHYPQCNGTNTGDLVLTPLDKAGAASVYGAACTKS
jgi:hypothetical protein